MSMTLAQAVALYDALSTLSDVYWYKAEMALSQENYREATKYRAEQLKLQLRMQNMQIVLVDSILERSNW